MFCQKGPTEAGCAATQHRWLCGLLPGLEGRKLPLELEQTRKPAGYHVSCFVFSREPRTHIIFTILECSNELFVSEIDSDLPFSEVRVCRVDLSRCPNDVSCKFQSAEEVAGGKVERAGAAVPFFLPRLSRILFLFKIDPTSTNGTWSQTMITEILKPITPVI